MYGARHGGTPWVAFLLRALPPPVCPLLSCLRALVSLFAFLSAVSGSACTRRLQTSVQSDARLCVCKHGGAAEPPPELVRPCCPGNAGAMTSQPSLWKRLPHARGDDAGTGAAVSGPASWRVCLLRLLSGDPSAASHPPPLLGKHMLGRSLSVPGSGMSRT